MKIKLSKLFLFSCEGYRRQFVLSHTIFLLAPIALIYLLGELVWWITAIMIAINVVIFFLVRREYPDKIELVGKDICFMEYNQLEKAGYGVKGTITLTNCRKLQYTQNKIERLFNIGSIKMVADASFKLVNGRLGNNKYPLKRSYTFYGVKNYKEVKETFEKIFN